MTFPEGTAYRLARDIESWYTAWLTAVHGTEVQIGEHRCTSAQDVERIAARSNRGGSFTEERSPTGSETGRTCVTVVLLTWWPVVHLRAILGNQNQIHDPELVYLEWAWHRVRTAHSTALAWLSRAMLTHTPERLRDLTQATWGYPTRTHFLPATTNSDNPNW